MSHDVPLGRLERQRQGGQTVGHEVDPEQVNGLQWGGPAQQGREEHQQHFARVAGEQEVDELADVGEDAATLFDRRHNRREVVVGEHHVGGRLGDVGPGDAHRHANVGGLHGGSVVHAIAGHRHNLAARPPRFHHPQFVHGRDPGIDRGADDLLEQLLIAQPVQLRSIERLIIRPRDGQGAGDRRRGHGMIAGDHHRADPRRSAAGDRLGRLASCRVNQPRQSTERQLFLGERLEGLVGARAPGECQHAERLPRHAGGRRKNLLAARIVERGQSLGGHHLGALREQHFRRSLGEHQQAPVRGPVHQGHRLAGGIEGEFVDDAAGGNLLVESRFQTRHEQRPLGGIAHDTPGGILIGGGQQPGVMAMVRRLQRLPEGRVAGEGRFPQRRRCLRCGPGELFVALESTGSSGHRRVTGERSVCLSGFPRGWRRLGRWEQFSHGLIAFACDVEPLSPGIERGDGHLVPREGAGLVGTDHGDRAQCLDARQATDQDVPTDHAFQPEGQREGHDGGEAFRDGGDREGDRPDQHGPQLARPTVLEQEHHQHNRQAASHQHASQPRQSTLQRGRFILGRAQQAGDVPQLCVHSGRGHDRLGLARRDNCPQEQQGGAVAQRGGFGQRAPRLFRNGSRLSGERRLLHLQTIGGQQAGVGGDMISRLDHDDVARDQFRGGQHFALASTEHFCHGGRESGEGGQGLFRPLFLPVPDQGVQDHNRQDRPGVGQVPKKCRKNRRRDQNEHHHFAELAEKLPPPGDGRGLSQAIGAMHCPAGQGLFGGQTPGRFTLQGPQQVGEVESERDFGRQRGRGWGGSRLSIPIGHGGGRLWHQESRSVGEPHLRYYNGGHERDTSRRP